MRHYSDSYFPQREAMVRYLNDYQHKLHINVQHNADARNIRKVYNESSEENQFEMEDQLGNMYICR